ncbi:MAG: YggU family protein [Betaproteobacteria bacterium RBG_16_56_24]|nr:MAG: YggU family protein [Betaproteobacteria bacterium RBG_16_56_24]
MLNGWYRCEGDDITLTLHVQPGAKRSEIAGLHSEALKIRLAAPPVEGRANEVLLKFIAELFEVPLRQVTLQRGVKSRQKVILVQSSSVAPESIIRA